MKLSVTPRPPHPQFERYTVAFTWQLNTQIYQIHGKKEDSLGQGGEISSLLTVCVFNQDIFLSLSIVSSFGL